MKKLQIIVLIAAVSLFQFCTQDTYEINENNIDLSLESRSRMSDRLTQSGYYSASYNSTNGIPNITNALSEEVYNNANSTITLIPVLQDNEISDIIFLVENDISYKHSALSDYDLIAEDSFFKSLFLNGTNQVDNQMLEFSLFNPSGELLENGDWQISCFYLIVNYVYVEIVNDVFGQNTEEIWDFGGYQIFDCNEIANEDDGGTGSGSNGPGSGGSGTSQNNLNQDFDLCTEHLSLNSIDIEAARAYHDKCGCKNSFILQNLTSDMFDSFNSAYSDCQSSSICKLSLLGNFWMLNSVHFHTVSNLCVSDDELEINMDQVYRNIIDGDCNKKPSYYDVIKYLNNNYPDYSITNYKGTTYSDNIQNKIMSNLGLNLNTSENMGGDFQLTGDSDSELTLSEFTTALNGLDAESICNLLELEGDEAWCALNKEEIIIEDESFVNCTKVKCVYDLLASEKNPLFCSTFGSIIKSHEFHLNLEVVPRNTIDGYAEASLAFNGNEMTLTLADDLCNGNDHPLSIAGTLLHEAIHASMYEQALTNDPFLSSSDYCLIWQDYFQTNDPCHEIMANQYVNTLAEAIQEMDNNRFSLDYYMYIAWQGLSTIGNQLGLLTNVYASEYFEEYNELINAPYDECD